jgi:hypothetical protein
MQHSTNFIASISLFLCLFLFQNFDILAQSKPFEVRGSITLTQNGIDPVPAFALGKPALMSNLFVTKGNFIYNSQINYSITDLKPWSENNWFLYKIPTSKKGYIRTGFSLSFFHKRESLGLPNNPTAERQIVNQYGVFELTYFHKFTDKFSMSLTNWAEKGFEKDAVANANFTSLGANITGIKLGKNLTYNVFPSVFYATNASPFAGFFVSETSTLFFKKYKIGLSSQVAVPIYSKPKVDYVWNVGLMYKF